MLVPTNSLYPSMPLAIYLHDGTNDTFSANIILQHWNNIIIAASINDINLKGFAADGAGSNRNASYSLLFVDKKWTFEVVFSGMSSSDKFKEFARKLWSVFKETP